MNHNGIPDYLETKVPANKQKVEKPEYDLKNEYLTRDIIFSGGKSYTAQVSAWRDKSKAEIEARKLRQIGYNAFAARAFIEKWDQTWYRVRAGYFKTFREAQESAHRLR
jgi:cell division protein FtsN